MTIADTVLVDTTFAVNAKFLDRNYKPGFGIFPSSDPQSNYFNQVWTRDAAHATAHYFARAKPEAVIDSLRTILAHQRADGALPSRVERQYQTVRLTPGLRWLSRPLFYLIEKKWHGRAERPVHEGTDSAGGEDTIPAALIMAGELFDVTAGRDPSNSRNAAMRTFIKENFEKLKAAAEFFRKMKTDPEDGLAIATNDNPDWADTIRRRGKLGVINIWWWRGLKHMETIADSFGEYEHAAMYRAEAAKARRGIMEKLYVAKDGQASGAEAFFRAKAGEARLDTVASIFGAIYFLDVDDALRVERTLQQRVGHRSGLQNFDPPYPERDIYWAHRWMGQWIYHNQFVWPWVALQNVHLKIKIAEEHSDAAIREQYRADAVNDLLKMAQLFEIAGGAYEVFEPDEQRRGETRWYHPPQNFMGTMAAYQGAYTHLKTLGWIS